MIRASRTVILAAVLAIVGLLRLATDLLTDVDPGWVAVLGDPLSVVFLVNAGLTGGVPAAARSARSARSRRRPTSSLSRPGWSRLNHVVHAAGGVIAYVPSRVLRYTPTGSEAASGSRS